MHVMVLVFLSKEANSEGVTFGLLFPHLAPKTGVANHLAAHDEAGPSELQEKRMTGQ
jgi:hypothetical protein